jgi:hypothetical protein
MLLAVLTAKADDIADAKAAFATLLVYQDTDDNRSLDLFAPDCAVTFTFTDGINSKTVPVPTKDFLAMVAHSISLKKGNQDSYEDIKYTPEGNGIRVTSTILYADSGKREPFSALYARDKTGVMKVTDLHVTIYSNQTVQPAQ